MKKEIKMSRKIEQREKNEDMNKKEKKEWWKINRMVWFYGTSTIVTPNPFLFI